MRSTPGLGLLNSYTGLILADSTMGIPFAILILRAFMVSLPRTLVEAALCDGAGHWGAFFRIILPLSRNALITSGLFCFLFAWSDFIFALTMGTKPKVVPITLGIYKFIGVEMTSWNEIMATSVLASIPPIVLLAVRAAFHHRRTDRRRDQGIAPEFDAGSEPRPAAAIPRRRSVAGRRLPPPRCASARPCPRRRCPLPFPG